LLRDSGLATAICVPQVPSIYPDAFFTEPKDPRERTRALGEAVRRFARFEPAVVMAVCGDPRGSTELAEMRRITIKGLRQAADIAADLGLTLGIEAYRASSGSLISGVPEMVALADDVERQNVGIIVDTWHVWDDADVLEHVRQHIDRIMGVQVCDWREPSRSWADRLLPGDGVIDWAAWFHTLDEAGYSGWYDLEIFSDNGTFGTALPDSIWDREPRDVVAEARTKFEALWASRRSQDGTAAQRSRA
jgi:sugar phosphate isomerase/epimerase